MLNIITLMENKPSENKILINKHGLSFAIIYNGKKLLFDCGSDDSYLENAYRLGVEIEELDAVILSHNHYDHAAGFKDFLDSGYHTDKLYVGKDFFEAKYAYLGSDHYTNLSSGIRQEDVLNAGVELEICTRTTKIADGAYIVTDFPKTHEFETIPERFVRKTGEGFVRDDFHDEIALCLETKKGLVVIVGCSHPGILNMISEIRKRFDMPIYAVYGGTHLVEADDRRISISLDEMKLDGVKQFGLCHCSGESVESCIADRADIDGSHLSVGDEIYIE